MVDNDPNNEEYKLDDLDLLASEPEDQLQPEDETGGVPPEQSENARSQMKPWENPMFRKGAIALGGLILVVLCYKMIHAIFAGKPTKNEITPVAVQQKPFQQNQAQPPTMNLEVGDNAMAKKLTSLEQTQGNLNATLQTVNTQISEMNSAVSDVSSKMTTLSANLAALSEKLDAQTQEIARLVALNTKRHVVRRSMGPRRGAANTAVMYSIQAIIPGRAWLISSDGSSMTVREGSSVAGYGVVKLIDAEQGRVLTSSGHVIRFSQVDS